jgi:uncharacterized membrane protein
MRALSTGLIGIRDANPLILEDSYWLLLWKAFTIGPLSADQHKQIGIRRGATPFNVSTCQDMDFLARRNYIFLYIYALLLWALD